MEKQKAFPLSDCASIIQRIDKALDPDTGVLAGDNWFFSTGKDQFAEGALARDDQQIYLPNYSPLNDLFNPIAKCVMDGLKDYADQFAIIKQSVYNNTIIKLQKTKKGGGFSTWHCERGDPENSHRCLAWMIYLNDVDEGGETEFFYQHKRVKPKSGSLVIWPADFTHVHRGNPPLKATKYIATGWINYSEQNALGYGANRGDTNAA